MYLEVIGNARNVDKDKQRNTHFNLEIFLLTWHYHILHINNFANLAIPSLSLKYLYDPCTTLSDLALDFLFLSYLCLTLITYAYHALTNLTLRRCSDLAHSLEYSLEYCLECSKIIQRILFQV